MTIALLNRLAASVLAGAIVPLPITRLSLNEVAAPSKHGHAEERPSSRREPRWRPLLNSLSGRPERSPKHPPQSRNRPPVPQSG
jgi:hypothetical protein